ncbi:MAG: hypothetical protein HRT64_13475, partial [Erythrobacter sp.]|nr:hypothetical protein [Erythrobacter sp.]
MSKSHSSPSAPKKASEKRASTLIKVSGGQVPGAHPGESHGPAFTHVAPRSMPLPVLVAVPHAGRAYPEHVIRSFRDEELC